MGAQKLQGLPVQRRLRKRGIALLSAIVPLIYRAYLRTVMATGQLHDGGAAALRERVRNGERAILVILHQDVIFLPWIFREMDGCTVASIGDAGDVIAAALTPVGFTVKRGGSSSRKSRRTEVFSELVRFGQDRKNGGLLIAITPDGSRGPAGALKPGFDFLALRTRSKIYIAKGHARRAIFMNTWDRTMLPLPFTELTAEVEGPFELPAKPTRESMETFRAETEAALHALHAKVFERHGQTPVPAQLTPLPKEDC
jgi:lysophospholipid acyltransferase (LPLAT)-like uncharacterized protein